MPRSDIEAFAATIQSKLNNPDSTFRKRYLRLFVDRVEVDDEEVRVYGPKSALVQGLVEATKPDTQGVPSFDTEWWWTQSQANQSLPNSLFYRENTGNFSVLTPILKNGHPQPQRFRGIRQEFPKKITGNFLEVTGK